VLAVIAGFPACVFILKQSADDIDGMIGDAASTIHPLQSTRCSHTRRMTTTSRAQVSCRSSTTFLSVRRLRTREHGMYCFAVGSVIACRLLWKLRVVLSRRPAPSSHDVCGTLFVRRPPAPHVPAVVPIFCMLAVSRSVPGTCSYVATCLTTYSKTAIARMGPGAFHRAMHWAHESFEGAPHLWYVCVSVSVRVCVPANAHC
jgi:hypothetical protein